MGFLRQVAEMSARKLGVDTWKKEGADMVLQATGENPLRGYIERRQAAVAEWVDLQLLFEVCAEETGFDGGGRAREQWWRQIAVKRQLKTTLKYILEAARELRQREFGRRGEGEGGLE